MQSKAVIILALVALALAEEKKVDEPKKDKRGLLGLGYGSFDSGWDYGYGSRSSLGLGSYSTYSALPSTIVTKEFVPIEKHVAVPVKVPYAVPVDRPYPVHVPQPYPVEVTKHVAVPVDRPVPVAVKVPVPAPYAVKVPEPYPVPVVKHVAVPVSQPLIVEKHSSYSDGWNSYSSW